MIYFTNYNWDIYILPSIVPYSRMMLRLVVSTRYYSKYIRGKYRKMISINKLHELAHLELRF